MSVLYGVGVGPGDPELITLKAINTIQNCNVIAFPGTAEDKGAAYNIAIQALPEIADKTLLPLPMPMTRDRNSLLSAHSSNAVAVEKFLDENKDVAFLTLGDPNIYSTFCYIRQIISDDGYNVVTINGITSFCAAASILNISLADGDEALHIIPAGKESKPDFPDNGNYVIMKPRGGMDRLKVFLKDKTVKAVTNCGLANETIYDSLDAIPDDPAYFTVIIATNRQ